MLNIKVCCGRSGLLEFQIQGEFSKDDFDSLSILMIELFAKKIYRCGT